MPKNTTDHISDFVLEDSRRLLRFEPKVLEEWSVEQAQAADDYVRDFYYFTNLEKDVDHFLTGRKDALPCFSGGKWFRMASSSRNDETSIVVSENLWSDGKAVFSLYARCSKSSKAIASIVWFSPSPNARVLVVGVCSDGSEYNTIQLIRVDSGEVIKNRCCLLVFGGTGVTWLHDSSGFYFQAIGGERNDFKKQIVFYCIATDELTPVDIPIPDDRLQEYMLITLSPDDRYHLANRGFPDTTPVAILDTEQPNAVWQPFITDVDGSVVGHICGDQLIAFTNVGAARGRVVAVPLGVSNPNDASTWKELVSESEAAIQSIRLVGNRVYISEFIDTYSRVRIADLTGKIVGEVPLPGKGTVEDASNHLQNLASIGHPDHYIFGFSSFTESWGLYCYHEKTQAVETLQPPEVSLDNVMVEDHWATSADGTRIPYHSVRLAEVNGSTPQPTLMYGYGGYNYANVPKFPGAMAAFIAAGGVFVHCHLRGGSEFGRDWWQAGRMRNKQNCFDDVYAIAEDLIERGRTTSELLAINGRSNGGLMSGVVLTQRPDLWKAVVPQVPVLDLIGALRHPYGRDAIEIEYADPNNPEQVQAMLKYSPYHLVQDGVNYPAVYLEAGATDPRCPSWHARKFGARLQAATASDAPVFVRIWEDAGHGLATTKNTLVLQYTSWLAFVMRQLGMTP